MGRGVCYPSDAEIVVYIDISHFESSWEWTDFLENIKDRLEKKYPSLCETREWLDNEQQVIMENEHAQVGVSEYMGMVALWVRVRPDVYDYNEYSGNLALNWIYQIERGFIKEFGEFYKTGSDSSGCAYYKRY